MPTNKSTGERLPIHHWIDEQLADLQKRGTLREKAVSKPLPNGRIERDGTVLWNFAGNDYLDLAGDVRLIKAAQAVLQESGAGARASALVSGRTHWHERLESRLAQFKNTEAALLFPTGYAANVGTICSLVGSEDVVLCDRLNHASLIDGIRLSKAKLRVFPHRDADALESELAKCQDYRRKLIVTDAVFSMDGTCAPVQDQMTLAEKYGAMLLVDEAHATGMYGKHGAGLLEEANIHSEYVVAVGTLSKAVGCLGGYVAGSEQLIRWLWNAARPQVFSTALPPAICAAALEAIDIIEQEPQRRQWLREKSLELQHLLRDWGCEIPEHIDSPIIPVIVGNPAETMRLAEQLKSAGILVAGIRPPTVPLGTSRLRISLSYAHKGEGIHALELALRSIFGER